MTIKAVTLAQKNGDDTADMLMPHTSADLTGYTSEKAPGVENVADALDNLFQREAGKQLSIEIGSVETVAPDVPADVTNSGTSENIVLDFKIPRGKTGTPIYVVLTPESTTWVDLENTTAIADAALPNPALCGGEYELTSPYGNKLVLCDILIKESGQWVYQTPQTYNAQGGTLGVTAFGPGDGKIHVCVAPNYIHFSSGEGKGSRAPNVSVNSNNSGAEIVVLCHPA